MNDKKGVIVLIAGLAVLLIGASALYTQLSKNMEAPDQLVVQTTAPIETGQTNSPAEEGQTQPQTSKAPDFTVYDAQGNAVKLSSFFGKPIVLNFWASWCGPCQSEMPDFQEKFAELGEEIQFLMVNMTDGQRETQEIAAAFIDQKGYTFPVLYDKDTDAAITYNVYSLPTTIFIDAQGNPVAQATGAIDAATLQRGIDMIK